METGEKMALAQKGNLNTKRTIRVGIVSEEWELAATTEMCG